MLCDKIMGSLKDEGMHALLASKLGGYVVEDVPFSWDEVHKRVQRKTGSEGTEVGIRLDEESRRRGIREDDVLGVDMATQHVLVARIVPEDAVVVTVPAGDVTAAARVAWMVGNTHTPLFAGDGPCTFCLPANEPLRAALARVPGVEVRAAQAVLDTARLVSSTDAPGHDHGHDHGHPHEHGHGGDHAHGHAHGYGRTHASGSGHRHAAPLHGGARAGSAAR